MLPFARSRPRWHPTRHRVGPIAAASRLLGTPVVAVVPLQRHPPVVVLAASIAEIAALAALIATGSLATMIALLGLSGVLTTVMMTNGRRLVALTGKGNVLLAASGSGKPTDVLGPVGRNLVLPQPHGLGVGLDIGGQIWWIDRSSFGFLRRAKLAQAAEHESP